MGWGCGNNGYRDIGYRVPSICEHPECSEEIDRGLSYVCGGEHGGGEHGCGLYFCGSHLLLDLLGRLDGEPAKPQLCERCIDRAEDDFEFEPYPEKPDSIQWVEWKLNHESWARWRDENEGEVAAMKTRWLQWAAENPSEAATIVREREEEERIEAA